MRTRLPILLLALSLASPALAGRWITPDWPAGKEPQFAPVPLFWFEVRECPIVYRTEIDVPAECNRATVLARTSGYIYVYVDGRLVYGWAPTPPDRRQNRPGVPADPTRVHEIDLSDRLTPGRRVLAVSAPAKGFVLDGGLYADTKRLAPLASDEKWTVSKFPPTTILEDIGVLQPGYKGATAPVKAGEEWAAGADALAKAYAAAHLARQRRTLDDTAWRLEVLTRKGLYTDRGAACAWGGAARLGAPMVRQAADLLAQVPALAAQVDRLGAPPISAADLEKALPDLRRAASATYEWAARVSQTCGAARADDKATARNLLVRVVPENRAGEQLAPDWRAVYRPSPEQGLFTRLNESRYDRLGWINHPQLADSDVSKWGVRINPVSGPSKAAAPQKWRFATDPKDEGVKELRFSIGYNIETQMTAIAGGNGWQADPRFADYRGAAWYRTRLHVPGEWAGSEVVLTVPVAGRERLWLNDRELTDRGSGQGTRTYKVPAEAVVFGGENVLALRIEAAGDEKRRGLVGTVEAACPALDAPAAKATPPVTVLATPLSPCVVLTPKTETLEIRHAGQMKLQMPGSGRPLIERDAWDGSKGRFFAGNWVLLWPETFAAGLRPILLVFQICPAAITCEAGLTRVKLAAAGQRVIAVRPMAKDNPDKAMVDWPVLAERWSRMALAVPVNYMEVTRVLKPGEPYENISIDKVPAGPVLGHTIIYDYLETQDEWGTKPLRLAPLPSLCSFALDCKFRGLAIDQQEKVRPLQDGGLLAPYRAIEDADRVSYSYPVEPYPRFAGFTSWLFAGGDAGVTGNGRECELLAAAGANSFRPQHNWADQPPPKGMFPADDKRTRVQITADYCKAAGINYMNNIDQTLGRPRDQVQRDYDKFIPLIYDHYEKIARQLTGRAFWEVAYDLVNEPFDHKHQAYNAAMKELTRRVRAIDRRHLLYIEPCEAWGAIQQLELIEPTGDPLTVYSFHDYNFRLFKPEDRWPTPEKDITNIYQMWLPAIVFQIRRGVAMHCGEFGGFAESTNDSEAQTLLMNDFFRIFDQFGMHHHYYSGRQIFERPADGSCRPSNVVRAYRAYFARGDFNACYKPWPGQPKVAASVAGNKGETD
jgi:hypothetical protein